MSVTPQQEKILALHRSGQWVCSTAYEYIRDHRKRISELNMGYLKDKGHVLRAEKCNGVCGKKHNSMVAMRRAEKIPTMTIIPIPNPIKVGPVTYYRTPQELKEAAQPSKDSMMSQNQANLTFFNSYETAQKA